MNTYKTLMFARFCASSAEHLDLGLSKEQQVCLSNECSEMMEYFRIILKQSFNNIMFVRFCIASVRHVDLGLNTEQQICLFKECIEMAKYYDDMNAMKYSILVFTLLNKSMLRYQELKQYKDAIFYGKQCIDIAKEIGDKKAQMDAYFVLARTYVVLEQYEDAIFYSKKCIGIALVTGVKQAEKGAYFVLGKAYFGLELYKDAVFYSKKCIDITNEIGDKHTEMCGYLLLVKAYVELKKYEDAIIYGMKCIDIAKATGDKQTEMGGNILLVKAYVELKKYEDAIIYDMKCIDIAKATGDKQIEMCGYFMLEVAYAGLKQYEDSIFYIKQCIEIAKETGNKQVEMNAHMSLAKTLINLPLLNDAFLHLIEGKNMAEELKDNDAIDISRSLLHLFHTVVGMHEFSNIESLIKEVIYVPTGSEQDLVDALDKAMKTKDVGKQSLALLKLHCFCHSTQQYDKSIDLIKQLKKLQICTDTKVWCNISIVRLYILMNQYDKALEYCQEVLPESQECIDKIPQSIFYSIMGQLLYKKGQWNSAEQYLREALRCFEMAFATLGNHDNFKISISDRYIDCYKNLSLVLVKTNRVMEALLVLDRCRARALKDLLISNYGMRQESSGEEQIEYTDIEAIVSNNRFSVFFYSMYDDGTITFVIDDENLMQFYIQPFEISENTFLEFVNKAFDEMDVRHVVNCENRSLDTEQDIENSQKQNHNKEESMFFARTNSLIEKNSSQQRMTDLKSRGETSEDMDKSSNYSAIEGLYNTLIGSLVLIDLVKQEEIVIIPDGPLYKVPFSALRDPVTGHYLSETKRIRLAPSIATLKFLQERPTDHYCKAGALIIGDPLVGNVMMDGEERDIPRLRGALEEAADIALIFMVTPLMGQEANKPSVIKKLQQGASVVHIAAHGSLSKAAIVLAPSKEVRETKIPDEEDYMLTMADVQKAKVRAQLVVLSCCHSGRGEIRAEGVVGMCRAFLASGARAVVASLWAINDQASRKFMKKFYKHLMKGNSASTSLHLTMNDMRQIPKYSEPKYWAPFFLMGDDVTINFTEAH